MTFLTSRTDSADDLRTANQADSSKLSADARYGFEERLGILAEDRTPTASQVALAWREAIAFDRRLVAVNTRATGKTEPMLPARAQSTASPIR